jgi:uncharacterized membrane protein (UPF0127 family)
MKKRVGLKYKNKKIYLNVRKCNRFDEGFGLMFMGGEDAEALLFDFSDRKKLNITSLFVFFPFLAIWLDDKNKIVEIRKIKPFSFNISQKKNFSKIIEIPLNRKYRKIIEKFDDKERFK